MNKRTLPSSLLLSLVFFAGFSFLIYEVSWFRMLSLVIGATVKASTIVLVAFMAGFGAGAWFWGSRADKRNNHHKLLVGLFTVIGATGFLSYFIIQNGLPGIYEFLAESGFTVTSAGWMVLISSLFILLIPAFFMGGILPVASGLYIQSDKGMAGMIGRIYAWETIGSTLGGLAAGFILIRILGQQNTVFLAAALNLVSLIPLFIYRSEATNEMEISSRATVEKPVRQKEGKTRENTSQVETNRYTAMLGTFIFGMAVIGLQVAWFRIFRIYMTNTSYTFSLIASMVILGLFAGSRYFATKGEKLVSSRTMINLILITAVAIFAGFVILMKLPGLIMFPMAGDENAYFIRIILIPFISALLVILPVTFLSGFSFPLACSLYSNDYRGVSSSIGRILLFNTAGTVIGPLITAFLLIPLRGAGLSVLFFVILLLGAAFFLLRKQETTRKSGVLKTLTATVAAILFTVLIFISEARILPPSFTRFDREIIEYRETVEGTWVVGREPGGKGAALSTYVNNSAVIGSSYDAIKVVKMVGHLPFYTGLKCKNVLVVGFGIGVTTSAIASHPEVKSIDCIELVAGLKDAAHYYSGLNNNIQNDSRLQVISGDGRNYLQATGKKYDLISSDPTHPILGSGSLYTKEYFELCKSRLNPGGMVSQYLPLHKLLPDDFLGIIKTFQSVFPGATIWLGHNHAVLLGVNGSVKVDFIKWSETIATSAKDPYFYNNPYHLAACLVLDSTSISRFPSHIRINTDNRPLTEFFRLSSFDAQNLTINLDYLNKNRADVSRIFINIPDQPMLDRFIRGNVLLTEGVSHDLKGNRREFFNKLQEAVAANPEDEEYPFLIKFNFGR
ncbi:MAG: fused MFS/spermidine synthase [Lentimicrobium sp.]